MTPDIVLDSFPERRRLGIEGRIFGVVGVWFLSHCRCEDESFCRKSERNNAKDHKKIRCLMGSLKTSHSIEMGYQVQRQPASKAHIKYDSIYAGREDTGVALYPEVIDDRSIRYSRSRGFRVMGYRILAEEVEWYIDGQHVDGQIVEYSRGPDTVEDPEKMIVGHVRQQRQRCHIHTCESISFMSCISILIIALPSYRPHHPSASSTARPPRNPEICGQSSMVRVTLARSPSTKYEEKVRAATDSAKLDKTRIK